MKAIGPSFFSEVQKAGLTGLPFSWASDGTLLFGPAMSADQTAAVEAVYAAHDPTLPTPAAAVISSTAFLNRFTDAERGALATGAQTSAAMLLMLVTCAAAGQIDLADLEVQAGVNGLVPGVLASTARATQILTP